MDDYFRSYEHFESKIFVNIFIVCSPTFSKTAKKFFGEIYEFKELTKKI
jgi:hypothetical protein